jgi:nitrite reductase/ring-hydroxylating ferredoxin subunit
MKKIIISALIGLMFYSCSNSDDGNDNCRFLLNIGVNITVNLNLPQYNPLNFPSNPVYIGNAGNGGIIVTNTGTGFVAYDAADPNHTPTSCSILEISGLEGTCTCGDENTYSLFTGQPLNNPELRCGLKAYRVEVNGSTLLIYN